MRALTLALALLAACGAGPAPALVMRVLVRATDDEGRPIGGVAVSANGGPLGATDAGGALAARLTGAEGASFRFRATCPEPLVAPEALPAVTLRAFEPLAREGHHLTLDVRCARPERTVALVLRTRVSRRNELPSVALRNRNRARRKLAVPPSEPEPLADVPVLWKGQELARTDGDGLAHVTLTGSPGGELEVELDTRAHGTLRPRSPVLAFEVPQDDDVRALDQTFTEELTPPPRQRRVTAPAPRRIRVFTGSAASTLLEVGAATRTP